MVKRLFHLALSFISHVRLLKDRQREGEGEGGGWEGERGREGERETINIPLCHLV